MADPFPRIWLARELDPAPLADHPHLDGLGVADFRRGQSAMPPHRHRGIEIHYVLRGHYRWNVEGTAYTAGAGDAFVTCPWHLHGSPSGAQEPGSYAWVIIAPRAFPSGGDLRLGAWSWLGAGLEGETGRHLASAHLLPAAAEVGTAFSRLAREYAERPSGYARRVDALLADLVLVAARAAASARERAEDPAVARLVAAIQADLCDRWPLGRMCANAGLVPVELRRRIRAATGLTPRDLVAALRIAAAAERLRQGADLAGAALDCGFASQQHLTTRFRLATGYTPGEYRDSWSRTGMAAAEA